MSGRDGLRSQIHGHFVRRWKDYLREQYGVVRSVVDSAVLFYIVIPALLIFGRSSYSLWQEELPDWLLQLPYAVIPVLLYIVIYAGGGLMTYQSAADVLFLRQSKEWRQGIIFRGILASLLAQWLILGLAVLILLPVLIRVFAFDGIEIMLLFFMGSAVKAVAMLGSNLIGILTAGWRRTLLELLLVAVLGAAFIPGAFMLRQSSLASFILSLALLALAAWLIRFRIRIDRKFEAEIRMEEYEKTRLTAIILSGAVSRPRKARARPWLFRRSNPVLKSRLPEDRVAVVTMKSFFRGSELALYAQYTGLGMAAVIVPPFPVNAVVFTLLIALLYYWVNGYRKLFMERELMAMLPVRPELKLRSSMPTNRLLLLPGIIFISAALGVSLFGGIWGLVLAVPAGTFIALIPWIYKMTLGRKKRE
ncbi:ABC transporter permease [Paenibacillus sp. YSY-4.3]